MNYFIYRIAHKLKKNRSIYNSAIILGNILSVLLGIFLATLGIKGFLLPNHFIDGGVTGTSMLISDIFNVELPIIILLINTPFVLMGSRKISFNFAARSALAILGLSLTLHFFTFPIITNDKVLSAIFGGISLGAGIGFAFRGGAVLDGTEILAILLSKRFRLKVGDIILVFNSVIFSISSFFLGIEISLYSVLTYMAASKAINYLVFGFELLGVHIISNTPIKIKNSLVTELGVGVTIYSGKGGLTNRKQEILFCVCSRLDVDKVKSLVTKLDKSAFITIHKITDAYGGKLNSASHFS